MALDPRSDDYLVAIESLQQVVDNAPEGKFKTGRQRRLEKMKDKRRKVMVEIAQDEVCWKCHGKGTVEEPVCGWCEDGALHSHCDDTWYRTVKCDACDCRDDATGETN